MSLSQALNQFAQNLGRYRREFPIIENEIGGKEKLPRAKVERFGGEPIEYVQRYTSYD